MQLFIDYLPILFFFGAYFYKDIYFATAVLMIVMPIVMVVQWLITRKPNKIYIASTALVLVLGTATLFFRNPLFLYWKPTVLNLYVAYNFSEPTWVKFKLFGMLGLTLVFVVIQTIWLTKAMGKNVANDANPEP
jgi:intracellular septation protein